MNFSWIVKHAHFSIIIIIIITTTNKPEDYITE